MWRRLTLLWVLATSMACWTSGGTIMLLYSDLPFSFSNLALYSFCKERIEGQGQQHIKSLGLQYYGWADFLKTNVRKFYPADKLVDLLAVGCVTGLRQGSEWARLHFLLTGRLVFALGKRLKIWEDTYCCSHKEMLFQADISYSKPDKGLLKRQTHTHFLLNIFFFYLWCQNAHSLGMEDLRSVQDGHVMALCLFILLFVFHLGAEKNQILVHNMWNNTSWSSLDWDLKLKSLCLWWFHFFVVSNKEGENLHSWPFHCFSCTGLWACHQPQVSHIPSASLCRTCTQPVG